MGSDPLTRAVDALSFRALDLDSVSATMRDGLRLAPPSDTGITILAKHAVAHVRRLEISVAADEPATQFLAIYRYRLGVRVVESTRDEDATADGDDDLLRIEAAFDVEYEERVRQDADALRVFGRKNVPYHVWPYWRELVSSTVVRMRFPHPVAVPHYVLTPRAANENAPTSDVPSPERVRGTTSSPPDQPGLPR